MTGLLACHSDYTPTGPFQNQDASLTPNYGSTTMPATPPPPISGGTLATSRSGSIAVAADPDRDVVWIADLDGGSLRATVPLQPGDEPGRVVESTDGLFHVALRRGGAIVTIDATTGALRSRTPVCPAPRGLAYDSNTGLLHVACVGGELVSVRVADMSIARTLHLDTDLRDVVVTPTGLLVTRFRSAELLSLDATGAITDRATLDRALVPADGGVATNGFDGLFHASVAWRMVADPLGGVIIAHQAGFNGLVDDSNGMTATAASSAYGSSGVGCGAIVKPMASRVDSNGMILAAGSSMFGAVLPVDIAIGHNTDRIVVVAAGNAHLDGAPELYTLHRTSFTGVFGGCGLDNEIMVRPAGEPVAVAFDAHDHLVVQSREPAAVYLVDQQRVIQFGGASREDTGHAIFHSNTGQQIACASCHPEGGDDGRTWNFFLESVRRTMDLRGGISGTAPFHWGGDLADMNALANTVFTQRMGGPSLSADQLTALARWIDALPALPTSPPADAAAVARGRAVFEDGTVGCTSCHSGPHFTNNQTVAVGTGTPVQVPRLVDLAVRAPYMHNGCATTLAARFDPICGGGDAHGHTSQLTSQQVDDLVAYLSTL